MEVQAVNKKDRRLPVHFYYRRVLRRLRRPAIITKNRIKYLASGIPWQNVCINSKNDLRTFMTSANRRRIYDALLGVWRPA